MSIDQKHVTVLHVGFSKKWLFADFWLPSSAPFPMFTY